MTGGDDFLISFEIPFRLNRMTHQKKAQSTHPLLSPKADAESRFYFGCSHDSGFCRGHLVCQSSQCSSQMMGVDWRHVFPFSF
jgi:hypothetical protein